MVGRVLIPFERAEPGDDARQLSPVRHQESEMVEAGCVWDYRPLSSGVKDHELTTSASEPDLVACVRKLGQADVVPVEAECTRPICDRQVDGAHSRGCRDRLNRSHIGLNLLEPRLLS